MPKRSTDLKNQAEVLALGLELGAVSIAEVVAWADSAIAAEEHPHWSVCELTTMGASYEPDVVRTLREVPGVVDEEWARAELVRRLAQGLADDRARADRIASALFQLAQANKLPEGELLAVAWWAWDALDLADQGLIQETRDQVVAMMLAALSDAASKDQDETPCLSGDHETNAPPNDAYETFVRVTQRILTRDGIEGYLPTAIFPERQHVAVLQGLPDDLLGADRERAVRQWAERSAVGGEEFVVGLLEAPFNLKVLWRNREELEWKVVDIRDLIKAR